MSDFRNIKDFVIVKDAETELSGLLVSLIERSGFNVADQVIVPSEFLGNVTRKLRSYDKDRFEEAFNRVPVDIEKLRFYANPQLADKLKEATPENVLEMLWQDYNERFDSQRVMTETLINYVARNIFEDKGDIHTIYLLTEHDLTSPLISAQGNLTYHFIGRGFVGFGQSASNAVEGYDGHCVIINAKQCSDPRFVSEVFHHEWEGHSLRGLKDHYGPIRGDCVMETKQTVPEFLNFARPEPYFCTECSKKERKCD